MADTERQTGGEVLERTRQETKKPELFKVLLLNDDYTTDVGNTWANGISFFLYGAGNPCTSNGLYRWGDYLTVHPFYPAGYAFIAANFAIKGANCGSAGSYSEPHNVIFGRGRDLAEYNRWKNQ